VEDEGPEFASVRSGDFTTVLPEVIDPLEG
jgi:hypothetical protein